jgi:hypothetical protein
MHAFHSTRCTMPNFSMPPPHINTPSAPLIKLSRDNIYLHCACTNKIPLHFINTAYTMHDIIIGAHTAHDSITHAPLNPHCAMLNLVHRLAHQYFPCITTLHCTMPNLSAHTRTPIFFVHFHYAPRNTKFKCTHPHTIIFHALPLCTTHRQI